MKIFKKIIKIIIFALAVFMLIGGCAFNNKNNTAFAEEVSAFAEDISNNTKYYIVIEENTTFSSFEGGLVYNPNIVVMAMGLTLFYNGANGNNMRYFTDVMCNVNHSLQETNTYYNTSNMIFTLKNNNDLVLIEDYKLYLTKEVYDTTSNNLLYLNRLTLLRGGVAFREVLYDAPLTIYTENIYQDGYNIGFGNGYEEGGINKTVGLLTGVYNIDLEFYANDVPGVVATVNNATKHYTPGGLSFAPYNEEYANVITSYQPEYPENFIDRCDVVLSLDGVPLVETLTNDYQIKNFVLNYPTVITNVARPSIALEFDFSGDFVPFNLELTKGFAQDYLTISASDLTPYIDRAITGIKITYYDRDIFSFYEPNALFTVDNVSATKDLIYGAETGYGNGYINGYNNGFTDGEQGAIDGGYDNAGLFAGAVAFLRLFFELIGGFMERKIVGDITFGLIIIGIPATLMIVDLIISLVRKFLGKSGGGE